MLHEIVINTMPCNTGTSTFGSIIQKDDRRQVDEALYQVWYQSDHN